jgi:MYXO-CTERM domain-containing protein
MHRLPILISLLAVSSSARATVVWADEFARSSGPLTYDYTGNTSNDYTVAGTSAVTPTLSSNSLLITDTVSGQFAQNVLATEFALFTLTAGDTVLISLDLNVSSHIASAAASTVRLGILDGNAANGATVMSVGWGYTNIATGDPTGELHFYRVGGAGTAPSTASAIGWSGGSPVAGFDFGDYNSGSAASNDTAPIGTSPSAYYRIAVTLTQGSTAASGTITNLNTAESASFTHTLLAPLDWGNNATDGLQLLSGLGGTGVYSMDNISVSVVPEPSSALLGGLALLGLARRRR